MSAVPWLSLHSLTRASIEMQPHTVNDWNCGCWRSPNSYERVHLCQYHQGFEDALDAKETQP